MTNLDIVTPRLNLPFIVPGQAVKYITHNEALRKLDVRLHISVSGEFSGLPDTSAENMSILLSDGRLAAFSAGEWEEIDPSKGWIVWREDMEKLIVFDGSAWRDVRSNIDGEASFSRLGIANAVPSNSTPLAVSGSSSLFDHDGADHRIALNKAATDDFATMIFQANYSGRAEIGLAGDDMFSVKVSTDGMNFVDAIRIDASTGKVDHPVPNFSNGSDDFTISEKEVTLLTARPVELYYVRIADALTIDELHTINGGFSGQILVLHIPGSAKKVTLKDNIGNLKLSGDLTLERPVDMITLICRQGIWYGLSRADN